MVGHPSKGNKFRDVLSRWWPDRAISTSNEKSFEDDELSSSEKQSISSRSKHVCFLPSYEAYNAGKISREQHLHNLLLHWTFPSTHPFDSSSWYETEKLYEKDPIAFAFWAYQCEVTGQERVYRNLNAPKFEAIPTVQSLSAVLEAYEKNSPKEVEAKLSALTDLTKLLLSRVLCLLSLHERKSGILELCLGKIEDGGSVDVEKPIHSRPFEDSAHVVNEEQEPELWAILNRCAWRRGIARKRDLRKLDAREI